jgi:two-component system, cell cycle sensor histidine kinase and response regulator CckA
MKSIGRLAGGVAHDYNNMLSIIVGYTEMILDKVQPQDPLHTDLMEILKAAQRLKMLHRLIGENIDLAWMPGKNLWLIKMDPSQIDQIMANLTVNARGAISVGKLTIEKAPV